MYSVTFFKFSLFSRMLFPTRILHGTPVHRSDESLDASSGQAGGEGCGSGCGLGGGSWCYQCSPGVGYKVGSLLPSVSPVGGASGASVSVRIWMKKLKPSVICLRKQTEKGRNEMRL